MRRHLVTVTIGSALVVGAAAYYYESSHAPAVPTALTGRITRGNVVQTIDATGTVEAVTTVQVGTQVSGTVQSLSADFNSVVRKGQIIARLDPSLFQTQVEQAQATVTRLEADLERARVDVTDSQLKFHRAQELSDRALISANDFDTASATAQQADAACKSSEAQVIQARAALNQARVNLAHTIIAAPIDGVVISRNVDIGQTVAASMQAPTLFVIARDLTQMQVRASVNEADIGGIRPGERVTFRVDAYPDETFSGTVSQVRLQPLVEQNVVSYITVIDVRNPDLKLKPGMTASVTVEVARDDDVLRVPNAALRFHPTAELFAALGQPVPASPSNGTPVATAGGERQARVWILRDRTLHPVAVRIGVSDGTTTAILGGDLADGASVVTGIAQSSTGAPTQTTASPLIPVGRRGGGGAAARPPSTGGGR